MNQKINNTKFTLITIGIIGALCIFMYFYLKSKFPTLSLSQWWHETWGWIVLIILIAIIIYWLIWKSMNKPEVKEVDTVVCEKIMTEKIAERFKIPTFPRDNLGFKELIEDNSVKIRQARKFKYPRTNVPEYAMNISIRSKKYSGSDLWIMQLDKGEEYIRNNYQQWFVPHTSINYVDLMRKFFPQETPQSNLDKQLETIQQRREEGDDTSIMEQALGRNAGEDESESPQGSSYIPMSSGISDDKKEEDTSGQEYKEEIIQKYKANNQ